MIRNLAQFRLHITQPVTGPPSSLPWSGFSGISRSVILVHMQFICTDSPKSASQSSSLERCNTFVFPVCTFLTTYTGTPSTTRVCTVCRLLTPPVIQLPPLTAKSVQLHQYMVSGSQLYGPTLQSYRRFCHRASFRTESCAIFTDFQRRLYSISTYSSMVCVRLCSR